ncbi:hypothetical protein G9G63_17475 [Paenibacillus sp. EKM202P]|uniref:hypothetical protein n=1 Tax=Paenibacillus sp. EKM202P TaxID=1683670 RepID=UPI0013EDF88C|nr:hypothetical protein [Paenibacillus sp. EKM202P]KAF6562620.1 hypothetical protein G9G63_17475 [Paenibacillus sp. EKM202P]
MLSTKGEIIVKQPKTKKSIRKVALPSSMLNELKEYTTTECKNEMTSGMHGAATNGFLCFHIQMSNLSIMNGPIFGFDSSLRKTGLGISDFMIFDSSQLQF